MQMETSSAVKSLSRLDNAHGMQQMALASDRGSFFGSGSRGEDERTESGSGLFRRIPVSLQYPKSQTAACAASEQSRNCHWIHSELKRLQNVVPLWSKRQFEPVVCGPLISHWHLILTEWMLVQLHGLWLHIPIGTAQPTEPNYCHLNLANWPFKCQCVRCRWLLSFA